MQYAIDRRGFFKVAGAAGIGLGCGGLCTGLLSAAEATPAKKSGLRLACAAYSFNKFSFDKTVDTVAALGLKAVEGFSWHPLHDEKSGAQLNDGMSDADRKEVKKRLADKGVQLIGCYYNLPKGDACRKTFAWAKQMGLEYLVAEPPKDAYAALDELCKEHHIHLAIHNHAKPNPNWNPEELMARLKDCSPWMGLCCDTGHWVRSGLDPVKMLKIVQGRIVGVHLKDVASADAKESHCVPFGKGVCNIAGVLAELRRQNFQGPCAIEYEPFAPDNVERVAECIAFFEKK